MADASTRPPRPAHQGPPRLPSHHRRRARLASLVESTPPRGICLVAAPPGYGATSLLTEAAWPAMWARPEQFEGDALDADSNVELALGPGAGAWIVVDDVDPDRLGGLLPRMSSLLSRLTSASRIAVSTYRWPGESATRLLREGTLVEVDKDDLAFTGEEACALLRLGLPHVDEGTLEGVIRLAEGWPAALAAVAQSGDRRADPLAWLETIGAERLLGPWLKGLPSDLRSFLASTSVLRELNSDLCDAVRQSNDSASLLARLDGTFVATVPSQQHRPGLWWRRHPMLSACLARPRFAARRTRDSHLTAARWFADRGAVEDQVRHLLAAGEPTQAVVALSSHEERLIAEGRGGVAVDWYRRLPPDAFPDRTDHLLRLGWTCALTCDFAAADAALADLTGVVSQETLRPEVAQTPQVRTLHGEVEVLRAWLAGARGHPGAALAAAVAARQQFGDSFTRSADQLAPVLEAQARLWLGDVPGAAAVVADLRGRTFATPALQNYRFPVLEAECLLAQGQITTAHSRIERVMEWLANGDYTPIHLVGPSPELILGIALLEYGHLDSADPLLATAARYSEHTGHASYRVAASAALSRLADLRGDHRVALEHLLQAREFVRTSAPGSEFLRLVDAAETRVRLRVGDVPRAERLMERLPAGPERDLLRTRLTLVRSPGTSVTALSRVDADIPRFTIERAVLLAWAASTTRAAAERHLLEAADLAESCGLATALVGCPRDVLEIANTLAVRRGHDWLARMVTLATPPPSPGRGVPHRALSPGELELISYLPSRASNADLAEHLSVSVNTVKTRLRRLYAKLGVSGRDAAVEQARSLGLL